MSYKPNMTWNSSFFRSEHVVLFSGELGGFLHHSDGHHGLLPRVFAAATSRLPGTKFSHGGDLKDQTCLTLWN